MKNSLKFSVVSCLLIIFFSLPAEAVRMRGATAITQGVYAGVFAEQFVGDVIKSGERVEVVSNRGLLEVGYGGDEWDLFMLLGSAQVNDDLSSSARPAGGGGFRLDLVDFGEVTWGAGFSGLVWRSKPDDFSRLTYREYGFFTGIEYEGANGIRPYGGLAFFQLRGLEKGETIFRQRSSRGVFLGCNIFIPIEDQSGYEDRFYTLNFEARYIDNIRFDFGVGINFGYDPKASDEYDPDRLPDRYPPDDLPSAALIEAAKDVPVALLQWQMQEDLNFEAEQLAHQLNRLGMEQVGVYERRDSLERSLLQNRLSQQQVNTILEQMARQVLITGFLSYDGIHYEAAALVYDRSGRELVRATGRTLNAATNSLARKIIERLGLGASVPYIDQPPIWFE